jgi:cytochrome c-type biogenesis protein CcmH
MNGALTGRRITAAVAAVALACALYLAARPAPSTPADRVDAISAELRCPVCQGLSVRDSPSETAREMRDLVAVRVAQGRSDEQIRDEFRSSYGDWVLLSPPLLGWTGVVWVVPVAAVVAGALVAAGVLRRRTQPARVPADQELARLRERFAADEPE